MDSSSGFAGQDLVQTSLARLREGNEQFEQFCQRQLDELESFHDQLLNRQQELVQERASWETELSATRAQVARLASVAVELADARAELAVTRDELNGQRSLTDAARAEIRGLREQLAELKRENTALENEIVEVQHRADEQKRRAAEERVEWVGELLRSALDIQSQVLSTGPDADLRIHRDNDATEGAAPVGRLDPVLDAVMDQFEKLQKGRERPAAKSGGRQVVA